MVHAPMESSQPTSQQNHFCCFHISIASRSVRVLLIWECGLKDEMQKLSLYQGAMEREESHEPQMNTDGRC